VPQEVPEVPIHCIMQCQRRFRRFRSTALCSARGGSGGSDPLHYTVPKEVPEVPVHCIIQYQRRFPEVPVHYRLPEEVPEVPVLYTVPGGSSGGSSPLYFTMYNTVDRNLRNFLLALYTVDRNLRNLRNILWHGIYTGPEPLELSLVVENTMEPKLRDVKLTIVKLCLIKVSCVYSHEIIEDTLKPCVCEVQSV